MEWEKLKVSSVEHMGKSNVTEDKSRDVFEDMLTSVDKEHKTMMELNEKLESLETERFKTGTTEIHQIQKLFQESQTKIKTEYHRHMEEMKSYNNDERSEEKFNLEERMERMKQDLEMKTTENDELHEQNGKLEEEKQNMARTIEGLEISKENLQTEVKKTKKAYEKSQDRYMEAWSKQKQAQRECDDLKAEKIYLEKSLQAENLELTKTLTSIRTVQSSFEKANIATFDNKITTIETLYRDDLERLKRSYFHKHEIEVSEIKDTYEKERKKNVKERRILEHKITMQDETVQLLEKKHEALYKQILKYQVLLERKTETYSSEELNVSTYDSTEIHRTQSSEESSAV